jgi:hypothetical protein
MSRNDYVDNINASVEPGGMVLTNRLAAVFAVAICA